jgi:hypothetical protein
MLLITEEHKRRLKDQTVIIDLAVMGKEAVSILLLKC